MIKDGIRIIAKIINTIYIIYFNHTIKSFYLYCSFKKGDENSFNFLSFYI